MAYYRYHHQSLPTQLCTQQIYVFNSQLTMAGDSASAQTALTFFGALGRIGRGWSGQSFALPMRDAQHRTLRLDQIDHYIHDFKIYTVHHPQFEYYIADLNDSIQAIDIAHAVIRCFIGISDNVCFPATWQSIIDSN